MSKTLGESVWELYKRAYADYSRTLDMLGECLSQRDEARDVARRLYRELQEARRELDELRDNYAILQRLYEVTNPPDNNLG